MIIENKSCHECGSTNIVRNGHNAAGSQRYKCKACGVTRVLESVQAQTRLDQATVERAYRERNSLRATARIFNVSHETIAQMLKKRHNA